MRLVRREVDTAQRQGVEVDCQRFPGCRLAIRQGGKASRWMPLEESTLSW